MRTAYTDINKWALGLSNQLHNGVVSTVALGGLGAAAGSGNAIISTTAVYLGRGVQVYSAFEGGYQMGGGLNRVFDGDADGWYQVAGGGLQAGLSFVPLNNNVGVRRNYVETIKAIPNKIDTSRPLREQAIQAFNLRNAAKVEARAMMTDRRAAALLDKTDPVQSFGERVKDVYNNGAGPVGDEMWLHIIESSTRSRASVNKALGVKP